jgi:hypothetical protein
MEVGLHLGLTVKNEVLKELQEHLGGNNQVCFRFQ